ncbi:MAG: carbamoyltransferase [Desulfurivibrionaceae bacterium]
MSHTYILGISAFYHDSAACLIQDGEIIAAAQEERFTRIKHHSGFPAHAVNYCLAEAGGLSLADLKYIVFYDKSLVKFERIIETYLAFAPIGLRSFITAMPVWMKEKLFLRTLLRKEFLAAVPGASAEKLPLFLFTEHHQAHAASAFYPSPFEQAAILCLDGVGEWATTSVWLGQGNTLTPLWEIPFPHSLGLLYSAFTYYTGFRVNSGEYKVMGLAPYGKPVYVKKIYEHLLDLKPDGTFRLNMEYFNYCQGLTMTGRKFADLFGGPPRRPESALTQREMDLARSIQDVTEEIILRLCRTVRRETGLDSLCLAGGVALNCVGNGRIVRDGVFKNLWIQPASGDAGGAVGAALAAWYQYDAQPRKVSGCGDSMQGSYLGPAYTNEEIESLLQNLAAPYERLAENALLDCVADELVAGKVVGWLQGRMEFGPRSLGNRSILGDPRSAEMQSLMNLKIKYRESFRPFAPSVLREKVSEYFELNMDSPYMLLVAAIQEKHRLPLSTEMKNGQGIELLHVPRSDIPAVTHLDYSARIQTVHKETNPRYHALLETFAAKTGCAVLVNTSFNVRGEPIVSSPEDAYRCFMRTEMDVLVLENCVLFKDRQPPLQDGGDWRKEFVLD